jgi:hypothetical protein
MILNQIVSPKIFNLILFSVEAAMVVGYVTLPTTIFLKF